MMLDRPAVRSQSPGIRQPGFTLLETVAAMALLATTMVLIAEVGLWSLHERTRSASRQQALEFAANILESARAAPFEELTSEWGVRQKLPEFLPPRFRSGKLGVGIETEAGRPNAKRVTVKLESASGGVMIEPQVVLTALISARSAPLPGGKP
jgi:prepilin-type N-terminal cleavage/methylation domain-containing protein